MTSAMTDKVMKSWRKFKREAVQPAAPEVVPNKPLPMVGLFSLLSDDQKKKALAVKVDESFGAEDHRLSAENC